MGIFFSICRDLVLILDDVRFNLLFEERLRSRTGQGVAKSYQKPQTSGEPSENKPQIDEKVIVNISRRPLGNVIAIVLD